jgi:type II secretory pathway pseudopilin PulG
LIALIVIVLLALIAFSSMSRRKTNIDKFNDAVTQLHNARKMARERRQWRAEDKAAKEAKVPRVFKWLDSL